MRLKSHAFMCYTFRRKLVLNEGGEDVSSLHRLPLANPRNTGSGNTSVKPLVDEAKIDETETVQLIDCE